MMLMDNNRIFFDLDNSPFSLLDILPNVLLSNEDRLNLLADKYESLFLDYIRHNDDVTTSSLAKNFGLSFEDTFFILKRLEKKNKIVIS